MADADEDAIPRTSTTEPDDLEDETQDFRFLSQLTAVARTGQTIIPKRGTKDFEPNPTRSQSSTLDASRLAMHTALSSVRIHASKNHLVGQYLPNEADWRWDEDGTGARQGGRCVMVPKFKSTHSKVMGVGDRNNWTWFLPEEALWLLERGNLDIRWPDADVEDAQEEAQGGEADTSESGVAGVGAQEPQLPQDEDHAEPKMGELPMSVQGAYASFIGTDGLTLERYTVYAGLKRAGYIVHRAPTWDDTDAATQPNGHSDENVRPRTSLLHAPSPSTTLSRSQSHSQPSSPPYPSQSRSAVSNIASLVHRLVSYLFRPQRGESCSSLGPLVAPGLYRNYTDIFRALALIPYHDRSSSSSHSTSTNTIASSDATETETQPQPPQPPYRIHFHVWKPVASSTFKKTSPPPPDYRICVIDARTNPSIPSLSQIGRLLDSQPEDSLTRDKAGKLETRIKHGQRNVLLAVVDMGVVSYLRLSDACFGAEKLFEEKIRAGSKGPRRPQGKGQGQGRRPGQAKQK
jgi:tRNA-splicing endonuclease subunit Sen54